MTNRRGASIRGALGLCCIVALSSGCASVPADHFYTLIGNPAAQAGRAAPQRAGLEVAVDSVTLPEAVDRLQLVIRTGPNSVKIMESRYWAESLKSAVPRAIAGDLSDLLDGAMVSVRSDYASRDAKYLVSVDITRFDSMLNDAAVIEALWSVRPAAGEAMKFGKSALRVPVHGEGFDQLVAAQAQALVGLSDEIAAQIKKMDSTGN